MRLTPGYTDEERAAYWIDIINNARKDPRGVTAFLESIDVSKDNYYQWFKKLRTMHPEWHDLSKDTKHRAMREKAKKRAKLPETEVSEKARRKRWTPQEKIRILDEFELAKEEGKGAALLRREGIYSSQIQQWRSERAEGTLEAKKRGPKANPSASEIKRLKAQLAKAEKKLAQANALIELQKKVAKILETSLEESDDDE